MSLNSESCSTSGKVDQYKTFGVKPLMKEPNWKSEAEMERNKAISQQTVPVILDYNYIIQG